MVRFHCPADFCYPGRLTTLFSSVLTTNSFAALFALVMSVLYFIRFVFIANEFCSVNNETDSRNSPFSICPRPLVDVPLGIFELPAGVGSFAFVFYDIPLAGNLKMWLLYCHADTRPLRFCRREKFP